MVIKTNALQTSPTMASPGPLLVMLNNPQQGMCALLPFHRWFSSLKINLKLILARFQENSEVQPTSIRIAVGWLTL
jgi:hypothetical protein